MSGTGLGNGPRVASNSVTNNSGTTRTTTTGTNLLTLTGYSGVDPEVNANPVGQTGFNSSLRIFPTLSAAQEFCIA